MPWEGWENFAHLADVLGVAGAVVSVVFYFKNKSIRDQLRLRFEARSAPKQLRSLTKQFTRAVNARDELAVRKVAAGTHATLLRLHRDKLVEIATEDLSLVRRVAGGTSGDFDSVLVAIEGCLMAITQKVEDDQWT